MRIIYVSNLSHSPSTGPAWSVPASVDAQSKIDEVLWIDISNNFQPQWGKVSVYHNVKEFGRLSLKSFPVPFNRPDVVVFEGFYDIKSVIFSYELRRQRVPYIIIPRCSLTRQALHNKAWLKKSIANIICFNSFTKHALAIQYLTEAEFSDSGTRWNKNYFIIPNGIYMPLLKKETFSEQSIRALFIGRINIYHKGLDRLIDACKLVKEELTSANLKINCYGPQLEDFDRFQQLIYDNNIDDILILKGAVLGKEKEQAILNSDVFIMTSRFEGLPMGLLEALSYGLPCLVSRGTNLLPEIYDSDAGWICEGDVNSIASALKSIISDKKITQKSQNARMLAGKYDWDTMAKQFHHEVFNLLNSVQNDIQI